MSKSLVVYLTIISCSYGIDYQLLFGEANNFFINKNYKKSIELAKNPTYLNNYALFSYYKKDCAYFSTNLCCCLNLYIYTLFRQSIQTSKQNLESPAQKMKALCSI